MNCRDNCPYLNGNNGGSNGQTIIRHMQGNYLQIRVPIMVRSVAVTDGEVSTEDIVEGVLDNILESSIELTRGSKVFKFKGTKINNYLIFSDEGTLPLGTYDITLVMVWQAASEVEVKRANRPLRYKQRTILQVVDTISEGIKYDTDEFNVIATYPIIQGRTTAIIIGEDDVTISEAGKFKGDDTPADDFADVAATYGDSNISIEDDFVTLNI